MRQDDASWADFFCLSLPKMFIFKTTSNTGNASSVGECYFIYAFLTALIGLHHWDMRFGDFEDYGVMLLPTES